MFAQIDCKEFLVSYLKSFENFTNKSGNNKVFVDITTTTHFNSLFGGKVVSSNVNAWYTKKYMELKSEYMAIYADKNDKIIVLDNSNEIIWMLPDNLKQEKYDINQNIKYQIDLVNQMESFNCDYVIKNQKKYKVIQVFLPKEIMEKSGNIMINYEFDDATSQLCNVEQFFNYKHKYLKQIIRYNKLDLNYSARKVPKSVKSMFLDSNNKLFSKYRKYKLVIQRD